MSLTDAQKLLLLMSGGTPYPVQLLNIAPANQVAGWRFNETTGTTAEDATATNADGLYVGGFTLNQPGIGDGNPSVLFNGSTAYVSLTAALAALNGAGKFNGAEGTFAIWAKVANAGVWTDGSFDIPFQLGADANNRLFIQKNNTANSMTFSYRGSSTVDFITATVSSVDWMHLAMTWSKSAEEFKVYINGVQQGVTQTALGVWAGALASTVTGIGDSRSSASSVPWNGWLAYPWLWNTALTLAQIQQAARTA